MDRPTAERACRPAWAAVLATALALPGCSLFQTPPAMPVQPSYAPPIPKPPNVERVNNGAIYQLGQPMMFSYAGRAKPRRIGDTLKVDIAENLASSNKIANSTSRENAVASKGPGTGEDTWSVLKGILNLDVTASGSDSYKGSGSAENTSSFSGQLAASVINVLPNGNLLVAGERSVLVSTRCSQLREAASEMSPLPPTSTRACATSTEATMLPSRRSLGSTMPEKRSSVSSPRTMALRSPATSRLPLGSTLITEAVSWPLKLLLFALDPLPL